MTQPFIRYKYYGKDKWGKRKRITKRHKSGVYKEHKLRKMKRLSEKREEWLQ